MEKPKKEKKGKKTDFASDSSLTAEDGFGSQPIAKKSKGKGKSKAKAPRVKAQKDVYTLVLLLSFLFFIAATVFLYLDMASYK